MISTQTSVQFRLLLGLVLMLVYQISVYQPVLSWTPPTFHAFSSSISRYQKQRDQQQEHCRLVQYASLRKDQCDQLDIDTSFSRRALFENVASAVVVATSTTALMLSQPSLANAAAVPSSSELERLRKGHARISYMLNNWESITQVCKNQSEQATKQVVRTDGGDKCDKTPLNVQIYMGYKSTEDPLYKVEKLMVRAAALIKNDVDAADYLEAVEKYREKADNTSMMAYTSSWGEANPNGGKDVIDDYLELTRADVVSSEQSLRKILGYLGLEPLPPSKNP
mmetsp:Transcript_32699/g.35222  ORF Transcript_32699/g.35222 Transcript_32699/m.35222 type:complete len:281 (+) Transcript_32699:93-935(+)